ncbi:protein mono-ADP-ribosyltransferase PARP3-like [Acridotheres tristis]
MFGAVIALFSLLHVPGATELGKSWRHISVDWRFLVSQGWWSREAGKVLTTAVHCQGEVGQSKIMPYDSLEAAKKEFEKKFREKTKNSWATRENFIAQPGKYTLIEVERELGLTSAGGGGCPQVDRFTLFSTLDVKMPLGKLSKQQLVRGFEALEELQAALKEQPPQVTRLEELSSRFYTIVPHNFGWARPPTINSPELLRAKKDMLLVLANIELAQSLQTQKMKEEEEEKEVAHPQDQDKSLVYSQLSLMDLCPREIVGIAEMAAWSDTAFLLPPWQLIQTYVTQTGHKLRILNIWQVTRDGEDERFKAHELLEHRRLLWHGTNVAVVAAILRSGLRIMPHSGGRVGKGIYFASENSKSASYAVGLPSPFPAMAIGPYVPEWPGHNQMGIPGVVLSLPSLSPMAMGRTSDNVGIMFLTEVALGKPYRITNHDSMLCHPPAGYDSVLACGRTEPDPAQDVEVLLDGKKVLVCQGKPIPMSAYKDSYFSQSEYLIYQESQCRIRYLVQLCF